MKISKLPEWLLITSTIIAGLILILIGSYFFLQYNYQDKIYPGVQVAGINLGGKDFSSAREIIQERISAFDEGIAVRYGDHQVLIAPRTVALNADAANQLVVFDSEATLKNAIGVGRFESLFDNVSEQFSAMIGLYSLGLTINVDRLHITEQVKENFSNLEKSPKNAKLLIAEDGSLMIEASQNGLAFKYDQAVNQIIDHLETGNKKLVALIAETTLPEIQNASTSGLKPKVDQLLALPGFKLVHEKKTWEIHKKLLMSWIGLVKEENKVSVGLDSEAIKNYLIKDVVPEVDVESLPPRLKIENGRVSAWQAGRDGITVDLDKTAQEIVKAAQNKISEVVIVTTIEKNSVIDQSAQDLGLKEIIGSGVSHFAGSPVNRRHNIKVGAEALHGLLIKPGEEFSLLKALGEIDASNGYLPELVIKENKTVPEYGGGLCQIGTTVFRATFNSGLPVTARRNHSYRVTYYEPAGTDATIYDPAPDYKFVNDTGHYILIQARLDKDDLTFDFWGTKDGREINYTQPTIYNIVKPAPTKMIETTDLPEGKKKCTESAHAGADAYFDYKVTYSNGEVKNQRFTSHYVPWQAVCLVGVKKITPPEGITPPSGTITPSVTPTVTSEVSN